MITASNDRSRSGSRITLDIPVQDRRLFRSETVDEILLFLIRHRDEAFSITELADGIDYSRPAVTKSVDVLSGNDLVVETRDGPRRMVQINRERITVPDDPVLRIPQGEFHAPVSEATDAIVTKLDGVIAVVVYGSVARGDADRRSDVDLWVLVEEDRMENQRRANRIRQDLEGRTFDGSRYEFEIDVEALRAVPNYASELRDILRDGIATYETEQFSTVREMIVHGDVDE